MKTKIRASIWAFIAMAIEIYILFLLWGAPKTIEPGEGMAICLGSYTFFLIFRHELLDEWKKKDKENNN
jgi:hypothetical protein